MATFTAAVSSVLTSTWAAVPPFARNCVANDSKIGCLSPCGRRSQFLSLPFLPQKFINSSNRERVSMRFQAFSSKLNSITCEQAVEELPPKLQAIVLGFQSVPDPRARYQQLLHYAAKLKPLAKEHHTVENKVIGCVSQVWVLPTMKEDGSVYFQADSDSALTKGLAALLVEGLSGSPPSSILKIKPDFIQDLGLKQSLTPSRNNGFLNMLKLMQKKTLELYIKPESEKTAEPSAAQNGLIVSGNDEPRDPTGVSTTREGNASSRTEKLEDSLRPLYSSMLRKLSEGLEAVEVDVNDVSHEHAGHAGVHKGAKETHFNVKVVSPKFEGLSTVKRHRLVYSLLQEEFQQGLHALSLVTKAPSEI